MWHQTYLTQKIIKKAETRNDSLIT